MLGAIPLSDTLRSVEPTDFLFTVNWYHSKQGINKHNDTYEIISTGMFNFFFLILKISIQAEFCSYINVISFAKTFVKILLLKCFFSSCGIFLKI